MRPEKKFFKMNAVEYLAMSPEESIAYKVRTGLITLCGICEKPLTDTDKQDPQGPQFIKKDGKDVQVHVDCYFDQIDSDLEEFPLLPLRIRHRG